MRLSSSLASCGNLQCIVGTHIFPTCLFPILLWKDKDKPRERERERGRRPEVNLKIIPYAIYHVFETGSLTCLGLTSYAGLLAVRKPQSSACLQFPISGIISMFHYTGFIIWFLGTKLRSSFLQGKHFTNSAPPTPYSL